MKKIFFLFAFLGNFLGTCAQQAGKIPSEIRDWMEAEMANTSRNLPLEFYTDSFFDDSPARLVGFIHGYDPKEEIPLGMIYLDNVWKNERFPVAVEIEEDGCFAADLPLAHPLFTYFWLNGEPFSHLYLEPGMTLFVEIGGTREDRKIIQFYGPLADLNCELKLLKDSVPGIDPFFSYGEGRNLAPMDFRQAYTVQFQSFLKRLEKVAMACGVSAKARDILYFDQLIMFASKLLDYSPSKPLTKRDIPLRYYDFLSGLPLEIPELMVSGEYDTFLSLLEDAPFFENLKPLAVFERMPEKTLSEYLQQKGICLSPWESKIADILESIALDEEIRDPQSLLLTDSLEAIERFGKQYEKEIQEYHELFLLHLPRRSRDQMHPLQWEQKDRFLSDSLGLALPLYALEVIKIRSLRKILPALSCSDTGIELLWKGFHTERIHPRSKRAFEEIIAEYRHSQKGLLEELPEGKGAQLFRNLLTPHQGKYVLVDFWMTSCAPCIATFRQTRLIREKYKDHPEIDFIYITNEDDSPLNAYEKIVEEYGLIHSYRLPTSDYLYLPPLFRFSSYPYYVLMDKEGKIRANPFSDYRQDPVKSVEEILSNK